MEQKDMTAPDTTEEETVPESQTANATAGELAAWLEKFQCYRKLTDEQVDGLLDSALMLRKMVELVRTARNVVLHWNDGDNFDMNSMSEFVRDLNESLPSGAQFDGDWDEFDGDD